MDQELLVWCEASKKRLLDACVSSGFSRLTVATPTDAPFGRWNQKVVVYDAVTKEPVAQFWLSFRRLHKRSKITSPRFNLETSDEISNAFALAARNQETSPVLP